MANNLQYILRPDSSTPQSRANAAYKKLSQDFRSGLNNIAQRYQPQKPNYISRRSDSRLETDTTPHGNWYKPTMRTRQVQENAAAEYDWDSKLNKLYREQQKNRKMLTMRNSVKSSLNSKIENANLNKMNSIRRMTNTTKSWIEIMMALQVLQERSLIKLLILLVISPTTLAKVE